jgi:molybdate transport system substrate-binding protein
LFETWGIADQLTGRIVTPPPGTPVGSLVARGAVGLGFQQRSELIHLDGIAVLGDLPDAIQITTTFSAAVACGSVFQNEGRALLQFLGSQQAAASIRRQGMAPAHN